MAAMGRQLANPNHKRSTVADILCPSNGPARRGGKPVAVRDAGLENRRALREQQLRNRQAAAAKELDEQANDPENRFKMREFREVGSRLHENKRGEALAERALAEQRKRDAQARALSGARDCNAAQGVVAGYGGVRDADVGAAKQRGQQFLRRRAGDERQSEKAAAAHERRRDGAPSPDAACSPRPPSARSSPGTPRGGGGGDGGARGARGDERETPTPRKSAVPRANEVARLAPRANKDFVGRNRAGARELEPPAPPRDANQDVVGKERAAIASAKYVPPPRGKHDNQGRVPDYLKQRQKRWASEAAARAAAAPDPDCPPGMVVMPEDERRSMLANLKEKDAALRAELFKLPLQSRTLTHERRKRQLEAELDDIERNISVFSRTKVFIKDD